MTTGMRADAARNRERLLAAAREAFTEHGEDAGMEDIARRAGVGVGTLYRHFETKDALVGELIRIKLSEFAERVRRMYEAEPDPWACFAGALREQCEVMASDAAHQQMPHAATPEAMARAAPAVEELTAAWQAVIERAQEAGVLRADFGVDDVRTAMCGLGSVMSADARSVFSYDWERQLELLLDGVRTQRAPV